MTELLLFHLLVVEEIGGGSTEGISFILVLPERVGRGSEAGPDSAIPPDSDWTRSGRWRGAGWE